MYFKFYFCINRRLFLSKFILIIFLLFSNKMHGMMPELTDEYVDDFIIKHEYPLHLAVERTDIFLVEALLHKFEEAKLVGVEVGLLIDELDINKKNSDGYTPFQLTQKERSFVENEELRADDEVAKRMIGSVLIKYGAYITLDFSSRRIVDFDLLREKILKIQDYCNNGIIIDLSNSNIKRIPADFFNGMVNVVGLDLHGNKLLQTSIKQIYKLERLEVLSLSHNNLTSLPYGISRLTSLRFLDLEGNYLLLFPREVYNMINLKFIMLWNNRLPLEQVDLFKQFAFDNGVVLAVD